MYNVTIDYTNLTCTCVFYLVLLGSSNLTWALALISQAWMMVYSVIVNQF